MNHIYVNLSLWTLCSIFLIYVFFFFFCQCYSFLRTVAFIVSLEIKYYCEFINSVLFFLAIFGPLPWNTYVGISLSVSTNTPARILTGIALYLYISWGRIHILTILNLPVHDHTILSVCLAML